MELTMINTSFWKGKKVFITGHTGFKGSWLSMWLNMLGAKVSGYALTPPTNPSLFELCSISELIDSNIGDIRDIVLLHNIINRIQPEIIFHLAAQPLVRDSYKIPVETYAINVMGTVNLLEAVRQCPSVRAVVNVTTDKCYENKEWDWGYRENEPLGGYDPYSNSKACSELVTSAYRNSYFNPQNYQEHGVGIATARAGNVIGGGDWAADRLIPDIIKAVMNDETVKIRSPYAIRPWQHVLEPLSGYLLLAQKLSENGPEYSGGWNFGPNDSDAKKVQWIVQKICSIWGASASYEIDKGNHPHEATFLKLDCSKAKNRLAWLPRWDLEQAINKIIEWNRAYYRQEDLRKISLQQIEEYMGGTEEEC
jgi:CDP-glucose 4,6-dehydratase